MRILIQSMNFSPEPTGIGKYSGELADALVERGHSVLVVCAPPYYPEWKPRADSTPWRWSVQRPRPGLTVVRCPLWVPSRPTGMRRLLHQASFAATSLPVLCWLALRWRPDWVFAVAPATMTAPAAWMAARLAAAKAWLHVQDLELDAAFGLGLLRGGALRRISLRCEAALLRCFDQVSTLSKAMQQRLLDKGVAPERTSLLPNWVDLRQVHDEVDGRPMRKALGIATGQTMLLFSGTMNRKQGLGVVIETARRLQARHDLVFVLCGQGECRAELENRAGDLPGVRFLDLVAADRLPGLLAAADIHLLPQRRDAADLVLPSKLGGMLASGRPVIAAAAAGSEIEAVVRHNGRAVEPEDVDALVAAITELAGDATLRRQLGRAGRDRAERTLGREAVIDAFLAACQPAVVVRAPAFAVAEDAKGA